MDVLSKALPPAVFTDPNLRCCHGRMVSLSLERGNSDPSCLAYVWLGNDAGPRFGDYKAGFRFGQLGYELVERRGLNRFEARIYLVFGVFVVLWMQTHPDLPRCLRRAFEAANQIGDLTYAAYSCNNLNTQPSLRRRAARRCAARSRTRPRIRAEGAVRPRHRHHHHATRAGPDAARLDAEIRLLRRRGVRRGADRKPSGRRTALGIAACWYWIRKLQARYFAGDLCGRPRGRSESATPAVDVVVVVRGGRVSFLRRAGGSRLVRLRTGRERRQPPGCLGCASPADCRHGPRIARRISRTAPRWSVRRSPASKAANSMPSAFTNRPSARRATTALFTTKRLPTSCAARFYAARGFEEIAQLYLRNARYGYLRWGADGKVRQLDQLYPHLREEERAPASAEHDRRAGRTAGPRNRDQGVPDRVGRDRPGKIARHAPAHRDRACGCRARPVGHYARRGAADRRGSQDRRRHGHRAAAATSP